MNLYLLAKSFSTTSSSSSTRNPSKTLFLQSLFKRGFSPTHEAYNRFLHFLLSRTHRIDTVLHFLSQMASNNINCNSPTTRLTIVRSLLKAKRLEEAQQLMTQMEKDGLVVQKRVWDSLIRSLCDARGDSEKALSVMQDCISNRGISPSPCTFYSLIHSFSSQGKMGRAIEVLEVMTSDNFRYPFGDFVCSSVISGFCKIGEPKLALGFYENAKNVGATGKPNVVTYTALVSALCKEGRIEEVSELVTLMENEGVVFDAVFYSSWICGYFRKGILEEAFRKHLAMVEKGVKPDVVSYTILIDGFSKEGNIEKAVGFLSEMRRDGIEPNLVTYTAIMRGFCKKGKLNEAFSVFKRVEELGIRVDEVTYSTLIDGLCREGEFGRLFSLLEEMEKKGLSVGIITYNTLINGLCKFGRTSEANEISKGILGDNFTYSTLLHGYIEENNVEGILETKRRLENAGVRMDSVMCNVLIKAFFMLGAFEDAYMTYKGMAEMGLRADSVTYCTMIDGYCKVGRIDEALKIFDEYRSAILVSGVESYNCIILGLCGSDMLDMAIEVFTELTTKALSPNRVTYMMLIKSVFEKRKGEGVLEFLHRIEKSESDIYSDICNYSINLLCRKGCSEAAFGVYVLMKKNSLSVTSKSYYTILEGLIADGNRSLVPGVLNAYLNECGVSRSMVSKILRSFVESDAEEALHFIVSMKKDNMVSVPVAVFEALTKQGRVLDAHKLIIEAECSSNDLDIVAYSIVVDGLCKEGHLNRALDLCTSMRKKGIVPNIVTYNSVINGLCKQGCIVQALRLFDSLENIRLVPSDITYSTLIGALSKEGFLQDAKQIFEKMVLKGFTPNTRVYNSLIDGYCTFGLLEEALTLLMDLENSCYKPDSFTMSSVINGCYRKGDMEGALGFYQEYKKKGILPDFLGFVYLAKGLCIKGRMEEARDIMLEMLQIEAIVEMINNTGSKIATESLASFLFFLCEQGNIDEATNVLNEIGSIAFPSKRFSRPTKLKEISGTQSWCTDISQSVASPYMDGLDSVCSYIKEVDVDKLITRSTSYDFEAVYSLVASLCSEGNVEKASKVAKEMLLRAE